MGVRLGSQEVAPISSVMARRTDEMRWAKSQIGDLGLEFKASAGRTCHFDQSGPSYVERATHQHKAPLPQPGERTYVLEFNESSSSNTTSQWPNV